ncbi:pleckstrin homology domain-containing family A member 5-like isoform X2 [Antennarius striatus]|uniref:pleckstrin homology domain-containing family A member 5-like isoform X2 n=1 Tax=Antennarius striatus TaxID=241820 RepID=UPI0035AF939A
MAANPKPDWLSCLPSSWSYGVTQDGRIFFINEEAKSTTWLHPVTGEAVITGHRKTPDLPTGWEEGYTFEGARCFINHNERKVTCKHPVSSIPSQDNCIFVVNEQPASKTPSEQINVCDKKERPLSTMSEVSNYTGGSDYSTFPGSPVTTATTSTSSTRLSRSSKKIHNFGKRSNSIKRNLSAPVVKSYWLYKQDSTGMKLWKKRWFVLSDMCLFYYRDEKEDSILGSILLPSFHISMLSVDDHIGRKYAFKATHPNMRTYYFCTDTAKEMESWMKVMTDAALVHTEVRRPDKLNVEQQLPREINNLLNHRGLTQPEIQKNERNRESVQQYSQSQVDDKLHKDLEKNSYQREHEYYTLQRDGERYGMTCIVQKDKQRYLIHKDLLPEKSLQQRDRERCAIQDVETYAVQKVDKKCLVTPTENKYDPSLGEKYLLKKDGENYAVRKVGQRNAVHKDGHMYVNQREVKRQLSLKETERHSMMRETNNKYGTIQVVDKYGLLKEIKKYSTLREGDKCTLSDVQKYATVRGGDKYSLQRDISVGRAPNKISSAKIQPAQAHDSQQGPVNLIAQKAVQVNGPGSVLEKQTGDCSPMEVEATMTGSSGECSAPLQEQEKGLTRTNSLQQLEHWVHAHRTTGPEINTRSIASYQTLPRNMPSHRAHIVPRYPEGYRTLPRKSMMRPDSICSVADSTYDRALHPTSASSTAEKRRSMRDDTMWQLYEWQQRQAFSRQSVAQPAAVGQYCTLPSTKTMGNLSKHSVVHSIPTSPSHGSLALYSTFSLPRQQATPNPSSSDSEVSSPIFNEVGMLDLQHKGHPTKYGYRTDRQATMPVPSQTITPQSLQGKTPEELTLLLIKLRRQQAELNSLREHTVVQLMALGMEGHNVKTDVLSHHLQRHLIYLDSQVSPDDNKDDSVIRSTEDTDIDTKLSQLCEQDKAVRLQEEKLQQLHREKHTLETALLSASQELREQSSSSSASVQSLAQQRDVLHNGLLSTCRELSRVSTELDRSWRDYDRLGADVTLAKSNLLEQLEALGSPQTEPPSQQHIQIQKELWRIQDVMEALAKNKPQRSTESSCLGSKPLSSLQKNEQAPDYRLYKSEPELTTVKEEVDEANGEEKDKTEISAESNNTTASKVPPYPVGIVPPRTKSPMKSPESSTIASYVTLRKVKKPESRSDRPRSTLDQIGFGEREVGRMRMSVEEQLERMRRNQQASCLREKKRETPSRSSSFSHEHPLVILQRRLQAEGGGADPMELEGVHGEQRLVTGSQAEPLPKVVHRTEERKDGSSGEVQRDEEVTHQNVEMSPEINSLDKELCVSQRAEILKLRSEPWPQYAEIINLQPFEDDDSGEQDLTRSPTDTQNSFQSAPAPAHAMLSPEPGEEEPDVTMRNSREEQLEKQLDSSTQLDDRKHNNMLASQTLTLVSSDT